MFNLQPAEHGFSALMNTDLANVDLCVAQISLFLEKEALSQHAFALTLLAREALNNAMVHGNKLDARKNIRFDFHRFGNRFDLTVEDQGPGFDWNRHLGTTSQAHDVSGRGHEIYRHYARRVRYADPGNKITLEYEG
jgi:serine/threonine-protein kinase RsbW